MNSADQFADAVSRARPEASNAQAVGRRTPFDSLNAINPENLIHLQALAAAIRNNHLDILHQINAKEELIPENARVELVELCESVVKKIDVLSSGVVSKFNTESLVRDIYAANSAMAALRDYATKNKNLGDTLEKIGEDTGKSVVDLAGLHKTVASTRRQTPWDKLKSAAQGPGGQVAGLAMGALAGGAAALLGPAVIPLMLAAKGFGAIRRWRQEKQAQEAAKQIGVPQSESWKIGSAKGPAPSSYRPPPSSSSATAGPKPSSQAQARTSPVAAPFFRPAAQSIPRPQKSTTPDFSEIPQAVSRGMRIFFDTQAYSARYTRELLAAIKGEASKGNRSWRERLSDLWNRIRPGGGGKTRSRVAARTRAVRTGVPAAASPAAKTAASSAAKAAASPAAKTAASSAAKAAASPAVGVATKAASGATAKAATKIGGKAIGKSLLKKIPLVGALAGLGFGAQRALSGDFLGAGTEILSGLASIVPGVGTAASVALDAGLAYRDIKNALPAQEIPAAATPPPASVEKPAETPRQPAAISVQAPQLPSADLLGAINELRAAISAITNKPQAAMAAPRQFSPVFGIGDVFLERFRSGIFTELTG